MTALLLPREAAELMGVSVSTVKAWINRSEHPLPSVVVGQSGRNRKVVAGQIGPWLEQESARKAGRIK